MSVFGLGLIGAGALIFLYCTVWIFVTPFLNASHPVQGLFFDISLLTYGPLVLLAFALGGLAAFLLK